MQNDDGREHDKRQHKDKEQVFTHICVVLSTDGMGVRTLGSLSSFSTSSQARRRALGCIISFVCFFALSRFTCRSRARRYTLFPRFDFLRLSRLTYHLGLFCRGFLFLFCLQLLSIAFVFSVIFLLY